MPLHSLLAGVGFAAAIAICPAAMAAQQGSTSGPAAGSTVEPSTAVQKQNSSTQTNAGQQGAGSAQTSGGEVAAGAPGVTAKSGSEGGPAPAHGGAGSKQ